MAPLCELTPFEAVLKTVFMKEAGTVRVELFAAIRRDARVEAVVAAVRDLPEPAARSLA